MPEFLKRQRRHAIDVLLSKTVHLIVPLREGKSVRAVAAMMFKDEAKYRNAIDKDDMG